MSCFYLLEVDTVLVYPPVAGGVSLLAAAPHNPLPLHPDLAPELGWTAHLRRVRLLHGAGARAQLSLAVALQNARSGQ